MDSNVQETGAETTVKPSFAEVNSAHFDKVSTEKWPQWVRDLHVQIVEFLTTPGFPSWLGLPSTDAGRKMLDYACGDGVISKALSPHFSSIVGVDVSDTMLSMYRKTAAEIGSSTAKMVGVRADLLGESGQPSDPPLPEETLQNLDLVAISMALHHFEDPQGSLKKLAMRLKAGGVLLIIDWTPHDGSTPAQLQYEEELREQGETIASVMEKAKKHAASHTVSRPSGFTQQEMTCMFEQAGLGEVRWKLAEQLSAVPVAGAKAQLFWARAIKLD